MNAVEDQDTGQNTGWDASQPPPARGFSIRAVSWLIDLAALYIANAGIGIVWGVLLGIGLALAGIEFTIVEEESTCLQLLGGIFIALAYAVAFEWLYGATPGKLVLGLRVVKVDGAMCDFRSALVRGLYRYIDGLFLGLPAYFSMKEYPHQRLGDKAANTIVVRRRDTIVSGGREWWWFIVALSAYSLIAGMVQILLFLPSVRTA